MFDEERHITIRKSTVKERKDKWPPIVRGRRRIRVPKYVCVMLPDDSGRICAVFGMPLGGDTRKEAVFWAERTASKNGFVYDAPAGWENVEGELPKEGK